VRGGGRVGGVEGEGGGGGEGGGERIFHLITETKESKM